MVTPWTILTLTPLPAERLRELFADLPVDVVLPAERTPGAVLEAVAQAEILVGSWTGDLPVTADLVAAAPRLAFVQQPSVGVDTVDVGACTAHDIPVANSAGSNAISVAEWCVGSTIATLRSLAMGDQAIRAHQWPQLQIIGRGGELAGRRVGIIGMGHIGRACAVRFAALGCEVAHWSRTQRTATDAGGAPWLPLDDLLARSDVLVVVVALAPTTRGLLGAQRLALLPTGALVINAARGGIIDESALVVAIDSGALAGGALDVYATEPLAADSPLRARDRLVLSPHIAGGTQESMRRLLEVITANVGRATTGRAVENVVNRDSLAGFAGLIRRREA